MSKTAGVSIGIMDPAYFVGRKEVLRWLNELLSTDFKKVEETANGASACQVLDIMFKGKVPMRKVNWGAKNDYDMVKNYKIIQSVFNKQKIQKHVEVEKLVRGKYQDNLEWMQWLKSFFEHNTSSDAVTADDYDVVDRRKKCKGAPAASRRRPKPSADKADAKSKPAARKESRTTSEGEKENRKQRGSGRIARKTQPARSSAVVAGLEKKLHAAEEETSQLKLMVDGLEKERDFYFHKLRDVELLLQQSGPEEKAALTGAELSDMIFKILYATDDDEEAAPADKADAKPETTPAPAAEAVRGGTSTGGEAEEMLF